MVQTNLHSHHECAHEIKLCIPCDTVYCTKCSKQWYKQSWNTTTYYGAGGSGTSVLCSHKS